MMFRMEGPQMINIKQLQDDEFIVYEKFLELHNQEKQFPSDVVQFVSKQASQLTASRRAMNFRAWLYTAL